MNKPTDFYPTQILPFYGLRYQLGQTGALASVTAPPYDVIDPTMQQTLYTRHPNNVVRLILNQVKDSDSETDNAYTRAADYFKTWQETGVLKPEAEPAMYAYTQSWQDVDSGETIVRKGLWALLRLEPYETGRVLPHEFTLKGPKLDRMNLMKSTLGNFSPIFMIYADPNRALETMIEAQGQDDYQQATDADGTTHQLKPVTDPALLLQFQTLMAEQKLLIADGHHRYETALAFQAETRRLIKAQTGREPEPGTLASDYLMVFLANMHDPGLKVYPTDRVLHHWPTGFNQDTFEAALFAGFDITNEGQGDFLYQTAGKTPVALKLKTPDALKALHPDLHGLDTAILDTAVFQGIFKQPGEALKIDHTLGFYRNPRQVQDLLQTGKAVAVFHMKTPPLSLIKSVCEAGHRMPQKSTYFYPKLLSGLVFYSYATHPITGVEPLQSAWFAQERTTIDYRLALRPD